MPESLTIMIRPNTDGSWIGGAIYFRNLINSIKVAARKRGRSVNFVILYEARDKIPSFDSTLDSDFERAFVGDFDAADAEPTERKPLREREIEPSVIRRALRFRLLLRQYKVDFLFPYMPQFEDELPCGFASWIPDLQHVCLPEFFSASEIEMRDSKYSQAASFSDSIVLSSESAQADFLKRYGKPKAELEVLRFYTLPDSAWYEGDIAKVKAKYHIPDDYFMVCNQLWAHKNHEVVIKALSLLKKSGVEPNVVFTGALLDTRKSGIIDSFLQQIAEAGVSRQCFVLGMLPRIEQIQLLRGARSVIQPSFFEGWSTVLEDCRTLGKNLIVSDLPVHREQSVPGSTFWDPKDPEKLAELMAESSGLPVQDMEKKEKVARQHAEGMALDCGERFLSLVERISSKR